MSASAAIHLPPASGHGLDRVRATLAAVGAPVPGAAPRVLHHAGALGFLPAIPMLSRPRRRHDSWAAAVGALASMAAVFTFSSVVIGPASTDSGGGSTTSTTNRLLSGPPGVSPAEHEAQRR